MRAEELIGDACAKPNGWKDFFTHVFSPLNLTRSQFIDLLVPFRQSRLLRRHAAAVIVSRVRLMAALFAVLVPLWLIVDWMVFPVPQLWEMAAVRLASCGLLLLLAWPWNIAKSRIQAEAMLWILLLVPPMFYLLSVAILKRLPTTELGEFVGRLYALLPDVVLAGLAIFPLTALEVVVFSIPALAIGAVGVLMRGEHLSLVQHGPAAWLMVLVMGVAMFSGMSQLHYIAALVQRAMIDSLTGAYTRRSGGEALELQFRLAALSDAPLSVAFFDLDRFKEVNDRFGHDEGDRILKEFAESLRRGLRRGDYLARWGGEEFIAILNETATDGARILMQRLHDEGYGCCADGVPITVSIGVAERRDDGVSSWPELVALADKRMYEAKRSGRNCAILPRGITMRFAKTSPESAPGTTT